VAIPSYRRGEKDGRAGDAGRTDSDRRRNRARGKFILSTTTTVLSEFGCLIDMEEEVAVDQTIVLMNEHTRQSAQARIVSTRRHRNGHKYVSVELFHPAKISGG